MNYLILASLLLLQANINVSNAQMTAAPLASVDDREHADPKDDPSIGSPVTAKKFQPQGSFAGRKAISKLVNSPIRYAKKLERSLFEKSYGDLLAEKNAFTVLAVHRHRYKPQEKFGPALVNANHEFKGISDRKFGYCWGFSTLDRYFSVLAFFVNDDAQLNKQIPDKIKNKKEWSAYYQNKIDEITSGNATIVPGFANLREFSLDADIEFMLKIKAMNLWGDRAVGFSSLKTFYGSTTPMNKNEAENFVKLLKAKLYRNEMPKIIFTAMISKTLKEKLLESGHEKLVKYLPSKLINGSVDIHSVLVYDVKDYEDGSHKIMLWDINFYTETLAKTPSFIEVKPNGEMHFPTWYEDNVKDPSQSTRLGKVQLAPEESSETAQMVNSLNEFCAEHLQLCLRDLRNKL